MLTGVTMSIVDMRMLNLIFLNADTVGRKVYGERETSVVASRCFVSCMMTICKTSAHQNHLVQFRNPPFFQIWTRFGGASFETGVAEQAPSQLVGLVGGNGIER